MALNWFPEPEFGGFYDAKETGRYAAAGLDVTILPGGPGAPTLEMLAAGQVDIAITGADDLLLRRSKGLEAVAVFAGFQHTPQGLMAHAESGIKSFSDLGERGGTVAIETGSTFQQFLWKTFPWEGKVKAVPYSGSIGAFAQDPTLVQQGYVTSEPCLAEAKGLKVVFLGGADAGWDPYNSVAVIRSNEQTEPWVRGFRDATKEGWEHYLADPSVANAVITRLNPDMPVDRVGCVTDRQKPYVLGEDGVGAMTEARWQAVAKAMGSIGQPVDPTGAWLP
jgi:NitT/TauT family transport system substrate-binding protein